MQSSAWDPLHRYLQAQGYYFQKNRHKTRDLTASVDRMYSFHSLETREAVAQQRYAQPLQCTADCTGSRFSDRPLLSGAHGRTGGGGVEEWLVWPRFL